MKTLTIDQTSGLGRDSRKNSIRDWALALIMFLLVAVGQISVGTAVGFAGYTFLFLVINFVTFRIVGGFRTILGACVALLAIQHVLAGQIFKILMRQPGDEIIYTPYSTFNVYVIGSLGLLAGALVFKALRLDKFNSILKPNKDAAALLYSALLLTALSVFRIIYVVAFGVIDQGGLEVGGFVGILRQFHFVQYAAIAFSTAYVIVATEGKRTLSWLVVTSVLFGVLSGWAYGVRLDMVWSFLTYVITVLSFRMKLRLPFFIFVALAVVVFRYYLSPYALAARNEIRVGSIEQRISRAASLAVEVLEDREKFEKLYAQQTEFYPEPDRVRFHYFRTPNNLLERFALINWASSVVQRTDVEGTQGGDRISHGWKMLVPRALNPDKPVIKTGNALGHAGIGLVNYADFFTPITIGWYVDLYNCHGMTAVFVGALIVMLGYALVFKITSGLEFDGNVYVLSVMYFATQLFSESPIASVIIFLCQDMVLFTVTMLLLRVATNNMIKRKKHAINLYERQRGMGRVVSTDTRP
jgi:hypothetical protein